MTTPDTPISPATEALGFSKANLHDAEKNLALIAGETAGIVLEQLKREEADNRAADSENGTFFFLGDVEVKSVLGLVGRLNRWSRMHPQDPFTLNVSSYGGETVSGFILYDRLRELSRQGHHVTTKAVGVCASMAVPIWLAGDTVVAQPNSLFLLHQPSFGAGGSLGAVEDSVDLGNKLYTQILDILSKSSGQTIASLKKLIGRSDKWLFAQEMAKLGFGTIEVDPRGF